ncbi:Protein BIG1 [Candida viswanathii]|uniref:Protein BIG1 n=1 Tax=Candida viswanathii TaxID=5486 RepID=A0A367YDK6_9ASCO|nr:Protein BIG1 [Candida viswanathii]
MRVLYLLALLLPLVTCRIAPVLVASHKLVRGLKQEINPSHLAVHNVTSVTNMLKKLITDCSSDAYLIVNLPGLTYQDMTTANKDNWPFLRKYLYMASTLVGLPRVQSTLDLDFLEQYIINNCDAETVNVFQSHEEVVEYYDVRTRVIRMDLAPLSNEDYDVRVTQIYDCDQLLRKIIRKLPSPHYSIIFTSLEPGVIHPVPKSAMEKDPDSFQIFSDILHDPRNNKEVEKNDRFHKVEPNLNPIRNSNDKYIRNKKKDEIHLFDYELWAKNEKLITTIFVMIVSIFMMKIIAFFKALKQKISEYKENKNKKGIITNDKKKD